MKEKQSPLSPYRLLIPASFIISQLSDRDGWMDDGKEVKRERWVEGDEREGRGKKEGR